MNILVSGASGNLGKAVVKYFLDRGHQVIGVDRHKGLPVSDSPNFHQVVLDLLNESDAEKTVRSLFVKFRKIDAAVLTAGGFAMGNLEQTEIKDLEHQYRLNFLTAYNLARPLTSFMTRNEGGKIFFIGSEPGMDTSRGKGVVAYSLAKSLLFELANIINADHKNTGVRAHVVVPGTIDTDQNRKAVPNADFSQWQTTGEIAGIIGNYAEDASKDKTILVVKDER